MGDKKTESAGKAGNSPPPDSSSSAPEGGSAPYPAPSQEWIQQDGKRPDDISRGYQDS